MNYYSTRSRDEKVSAKEAIFRGPADDGGLYVPETIPAFPYEDFLNSKYEELAAAVLSVFFEDFDPAYLKESADKAYASFKAEGAVGYHELDGISVAELFHGPTAAFKDFALQILPYLMAGSAEGRRVRILTATSGDTGKAALAGFQDVENTDIFVFYPEEGVSTVQKLQMTTQEGENVHVFGIRGNFDDAQRTVKALFRDEELREEGRASGIEFSSANSINIGRLVPQVVYYIYSYLELVRRGTVDMGEKVDVCVPTGNFGNILAAMYAKRMGVPFDDFICASNKNHVLTDFIQTGVYDTHRDFYKTTSPSMDILVASNIERFLQLLLKNNDKIREKMESLQETGRFEIPEDLIRRAKLVGYWSTDDEGEARIKEVFESTGYLMDPHTAVAYDGIKKHGPKRHVLLMSTASPYKFPETVADALSVERGEDEKSLLESIREKSHMEIPKELLDVFEKTVRFEGAIGIDEMGKVVREGFDD